jgi:hypothetical protein
MICFIFTVACSSENQNHLQSSKIEKASQRVKVLKKYFRLRSKTFDAEFDIFDVNLAGSRITVPGPTSRDYKVALLTDQAGIKLWSQDVKLIQTDLSYEWGLELIKSNSSFKLNEKPKYYSSTAKKVIIFEDAGIVFVRIEQH